MDGLSPTSQQGGDSYQPAAAASCAMQPPLVTDEYLYLAAAVAAVTTVVDEPLFTSPTGLGQAIPVAPAAAPAPPPSAGGPTSVAKPAPRQGWAGGHFRSGASTGRGVGAATCVSLEAAGTAAAVAAAAAAPATPPAEVQLTAPPVSGALLFCGFDELDNIPAYTSTTTDWW